MRGGEKYDCADRINDCLIHWIVLGENVGLIDVRGLSDAEKIG
jgi:hypothetical protein